MQLPLFSILIANYNNGEYLQKAIDSVFSQSYQNWEIIIVDDKSTDESQVVYDRYAESNRIHVYYNNRNRGCGYTKRQCVNYASGELCAFLDPDDALVDSALEIMVNALYNKEGISFAYSRYYECDVDLNPINISSSQMPLPKGTSFLEYGECAISHFYVFNKECYSLTPGINEYAIRSVDHDLYYLMEEVGSGIFVDKPLYYYRTATGRNISLGRNAETAFLWDIVAMTDACRRRGLSVEKIVFPNIFSFISSKENAILNSRAYKLGNFIIKPMKVIKHKLLPKAH